jgi:hypothetical protein
LKKLTANMSLYNKLRYEFTVMAGRCPCCKKSKKEDGFVRCENCREKIRNQKISPDKRKEYNKNLYQNRISKGLCTKCGQNPHVSNKKLCQICLDKTAIYHAKQKTLKTATK